MSFFGLTSLGSQNPFEIVKDTPLQVFERDDFQLAFMRTFQEGFTLHSECEELVMAAHKALQTASIRYDQLPTMLQVLYRCPKGINNVPSASHELVMSGFEEFQSRLISLTEFLTQMEALCRESEALETQKAQREYLKDGLATREFVSNNDFRGKLVKHTRMDRDPRDKLLTPMTESQTLGWQPPTSIAVRKPMRSCEETRYASAMVKAGVYYY